MSDTDRLPDSLLVLRVWLPDRPGALGAVASRIGAVGADLVGIEIVDRGAGRVVDELSVSIPDPGLVDLLVSEIHAVEGTDVEDSRWVSGVAEDPVVASLALAARLSGGLGHKQLVAEMVRGAVALLHADWAVLVDTEAEELLGAATMAGVETAPTASWVCSFVRGVTGSPIQDPATLDDVAFSSIEGTPLVLVAARQRVPLRGRERSVLDQLCALGASQPALRA